MDDSRPLLTVAEVAKRLDVSVHQVYRRITCGDLKATRVKVKNLEWRVAEEDLADFQAGHGNEWLSAPDAAILLGFSPETVRRMCKQGKLPSSRGAGKAGHYRVSRTAIAEYLAAGA